MKRLLKIALGTVAITAACHASAQVKLFKDDNFSGRSVTFDHSIRDLANHDFNDQASSAVVRGGPWTLCTEARFRGRCVTLRPGRYASLTQMGLNDKVSSLRAGNDSRNDDGPRR